MVARVISDDRYTADAKNNTFILILKRQPFTLILVKNNQIFYKLLPGDFKSIKPVLTTQLRLVEVARTCSALTLTRQSRVISSHITRRESNEIAETFSSV